MIEVVALAAAAWLVAAIFGGAPASSALAWPAAWGKMIPSAKVFMALRDASKAHKVPLALLLAICKRESQFNRNVKHVVLPKSYEKNRHKTIPGSNGKTFGEVVAPEDWHAWGMMALLPINLYGVPNGLKASDPLSKALEPRLNARLGAQYLRAAYEKRGSWVKAIWSYNASELYVNDVLAYVAALGGNVDELRERAA